VPPAAPQAASTPAAQSTPPPAAAADATDAKDKKPAAARDTVSKPMTEKQRKKQEAKLRKELETPYRKWLNEDVTYIITDEERTAFKRLNTDDEREQFIEQFWLRRDPTPDTEENEFKEEHYRRIAYANEHYASGIPGWKADRGRIYITFGPPTKSSRILPAELTIAPTKKVAAPLQPTPSSNGVTATSRASAATS